MLIIPVNTLNFLVTVYFLVRVLGCNGTRAGSKVMQPMMLNDN